MTARPKAPPSLIDQPAELALLGILMREPKRFEDKRVRRALFAALPYARVFDRLRAAYAENRLGGDLATASAAIELDATIDSPRSLAVDAYLAAEDVMPEPILTHVVRLARRRQARALAFGLQATAEHPSTVAGDDREALATIAASVAELAEPAKEDRAWERVADVPVQRVAWLWGGRIPVGKITLIEGDPGLGKSTITLDVAARVSRGAPLEGDRKSSNRRACVMIGAEDDIADTLRPRLEAAGADLTRIVEPFASNDHRRSRTISGRVGQSGRRFGRSTQAALVFEP